MTTHTGYVMTLANSIIGVSLLAMPYCFKQCGLALGIFLLLVSNITTRLACHFLVKSAVMCRRKSFEYVAYHAFGSTGKLMVELGVIGFMLGTSVAFFVVMGDLAPTILSKMLHIENNDSLRTSVLLIAGIFVVLPMSLLRNIESLAAISTVTMMFYMLLVFKVLTESFPHLAAADWPTKVNYWRPEGVLQCFPIFAMALSCQTQVFEILEVLPNPTLERMNDVVRAAVALCTGLYVAVGFLGYVAYARDTFGGNVLLSFSPSPSSDLFQLGFVISIALSFPIVVFPCRASLNSLLYKKGAQYQELTTQSSYIPDGRFKLLTAGIVGVALGTGLLIPSIEVVLGFVGSTIGVAICVIFPAAAFVNISTKKTSERLVAKMILVVGVAVMLLGVYGNLDAAADRKLQTSPLESAVVNSPVPPQLKLQLPKDIPLPKNEEVKKLVVERIEPPPPAAPKESEPAMRREPPVPVEPAAPAPENPQKPPVAPPEVVSKPSLPAHSVDPLPVNSKVIEEPVAVKAEPVVPKLKIEAPVTPDSKAENQPKKMDAIHEDAIAREELELKEDDSLQKKEQDLKEQELLKKLKEHQEEQKQLLKEQQHILEEIKSRDGEPVPPKPVEPIEPQKFSDNIEKIQEVIDDLKERKQVIDKTNGERIAEEKKKKAERKNNVKVVESPEKVVEVDQAFVGVKSVVPSGTNVSAVPEARVAVPLPLLKKQEQPVPANAGRDILGVSTAPVLDREKREAEDGSCSKTENGGKSVMTSQSDVEPSAVKQSADTLDNIESDHGIKESKIISAPIIADLRQTASEEMVGNSGKVVTPKVSNLLPSREETRRRRRK